MPYAHNPRELWGHWQALANQLNFSDRYNTAPKISLYGIALSEQVLQGIDCVNAKVGVVLPIFRGNFLRSDVNHLVIGQELISGVYVDRSWWPVPGFAQEIGQLSSGHTPEFSTGGES